MLTREQRERMAELIANARRARGLTGDPYVIALVDLSDAIEAYFAARFRYKTCGNGEVVAAAHAYSATENDLRVVITQSYSRIERSIATLGAEYEPPPEWQMRVLERISVQPPERWWKRLWLRLRGVR